MIQFFYVAFLISPFINAFGLFVTYLTVAWYLLKRLLFGHFLKSSSKNWIIEYSRPGPKQNSFFWFFYINVKNPKKWSLLRPWSKTISKIGKNRSKNVTGWFRWFFLNGRIYGQKELGWTVLSVDCPVGQETFISRVWYLFQEKRSLLRFFSSTHHDFNLKERYYEPIPKIP